MRFQSLRGFREFLPEACGQREHLFRCWRRAAYLHGFVEYDGPVLEPLELYIEKSGEEIVNQLYWFEDRGGERIALRPEMTPTLARLVGAQGTALKRPARWYHIGEHYRYERPQKGRTRAFFQFNVDLLGEEGPGAEAELIACLGASLELAGLGPRDYRIRLSDRQLWVLLVQAWGVAEGAALSEVLGAIDKMGRDKQERTLERLRPHLDDPEAFLNEMHRLREVDSLPALRGWPQEALRSPETEAWEARLGAWEDLLGRLEALGVMPSVQIDLGIVRGLAYYTGFVFEAFEEGAQSRSLAGGGRYDDLIGKITGTAMPAAGFAIGDVTLMDALAARGRIPAYIDKPDAWIIFGGEAEKPAALSTATALRQAGLRAEYALRPLGFSKQFREANQRGAALAIVLGADEVAQAEAKIKVMATGEEHTVPARALAAAARSLLAGEVPEADS